MKRILITLAIAVCALQAQSTQGRRSTVIAQGDGSVSVTPDQGKVNLSVVTQAQTAQEASASNATIAGTVISQVRALIGVSGDVKTVSYSLSPMYSYGTPPTLLGFSATNTIAVTVNDLTLIGRVIDTGVQAGASRIDSLQFTLKDDSTAKAAALKAATIRAKAKADAMALALGYRTGSVFTIQESGVAIQPIAGVASGVSTPIQTGTVDVRANVTIEVELVQ